MGIAFPAAYGNLTAHMPDFLASQARRITRNCVVVGLISLVVSAAVLWFLRGEERSGMAFGGMVLFGALLFLGYALRWTVNPDSHPVRQAVRRLGLPDQTSQIDSEVQADVAHFADIHVTRSMLLFVTIGGFDVVRLDNIAAASGQLESYNYFLLLATKDGRQLKWIVRGDRNALLQAVRAAAHLEQ
jgi:hypothetical protein